MFYLLFLYFEYTSICRHMSLKSNISNLPTAVWTPGGEKCMFCIYLSLTMSWTVQWWRLECKSECKLFFIQAVLKLSMDGHSDPQPSLGCLCSNSLYHCSEDIPCVNLFRTVVSSSPHEYVLCIMSYLMNCRRHFRRIIFSCS